MPKTPTITNNPHYDICYRVGNSSVWEKRLGLDTDSSEILCRMLIGLKRNFRVRSELTGKVQKFTMPYDGTEAFFFLLHLFYNRLSDRCGKDTGKVTVDETL